MYDETNVPGPEVRVRPVVRYLVTTYYHGYMTKDVSGEPFAINGSSKVVCECENERQADEVVNALQALHDHTMAAIHEQATQPQASA